MLGIRQPRAVLIKVGDERDRHVLTALRDVQIVERVVRAAEHIGDDLMKELAAEIEGRGKGVITVTAAADAVSRFEHDGPQPERGELLARPQPGDAGANHDHIDIG